VDPDRSARTRGHEWATGSIKRAGTRSVVSSRPLAWPGLHQGGFAATRRQRRCVARAADREVSARYLGLDTSGGARPGASTWTSRACALGCLAAKGSLTCIGPAISPKECHQVVSLPRTAEDQGGNDLATTRSLARFGRHQPQVVEPLAYWIGQSHADGSCDQVR
jgi:hypothetical protein